MWFQAAKSGANADLVFGAVVEVRSMLLLLMGSDLIRVFGSTVSSCLRICAPRGENGRLGVAVTLGHSVNSN